jgi:signal transduction histidine kinase
MLHNNSMDWQRLEQAERRQAILESIVSLSYRVQDLSIYLNKVAAGVAQLLQSDWALVTLHQVVKGQIIASSLDLSSIETEFSVHESVSRRVVQSGQPFFIEDIKQQPDEAKRMAGYSCYLGVPLRTFQGEIIGTLCSFSTEPQHYDAALIAAVERCAERAATAIDNYQLYQKQQQFNNLLESEVNKRTIELRTAQAKLIEHERLAAIGEFAAMIVHEIRNPLTTVQLGLNYFTKLDLPAAAQARLGLATSEADRLANLLQEILAYSKPQALQLVEIEVNQFIEDLLVALKLMPEAEGRTIDFTPLDHSVSLWVDQDKLKQVLINLIRNACEAVDVGETIHWTATCPALLPKHLCLSIQNQGVVIPAEIISQLTKPFYSTKPDGTGLGLAIVKRIVEAHHGKLLIQSSEATGTVFEVQLPLILGYLHS